MSPSIKSASTAISSRWSSPKICARAERALEKIHVEYEPLPPVFDAVEALAPGAPILHEERGSNLLLEDSLAWGDIDEGFRQAERIFEETYSSPSMFHHPMEPVGGCLAHYVNGEVNVWLPTSSPMRDAAEFAHFLGIEPDKVRRARALCRRRLRLEDPDAGAFCGAVTFAQDRPAGALDAFGGV